ncbi:hypothetical protein V8C42DRAFT_64111 [Trichoderma barbatum]
MYESIGKVEEAIELNTKGYNMRLEEEPRKGGLLGGFEQNLGYNYNTANQHETALLRFEKSCVTWTRWNVKEGREAAGPRSQRRIPRGVFCNWGGTMRRSHYSTFQSESSSKRNLLTGLCWLTHISSKASLNDVEADQKLPRQTSWKHRICGLKVIRRAFTRSMQDVFIKRAWFA